MPERLFGVGPDEVAIQRMVEEALNEGWKVERLGQGSDAGQGLMIRELKDGKLTGRIIQWHPGGGRHGPEPYWKVSSPEGDTRRIGPQFPGSENPGNTFPGFYCIIDDDN
jgi:hypothetical protein